MLNMLFEVEPVDCNYIEDYCTVYRKSLSEFLKECIFLHKRRQNQKFDPETLLVATDEECAKVFDNSIEKPNETINLIENSEKKGKRHGKKEISNGSQ